MSNSTVATEIQTTTTSPAVLMLAFEHGKECWQLGFSTGLGQKVHRRKIAAAPVLEIRVETAQRFRG